MLDIIKKLFRPKQDVPATIQDPVYLLALAKKMKERELRCSGYSRAESVRIASEFYRKK